MDRRHNDVTFLTKVEESFESGVGNCLFIHGKTPLMTYFIHYNSAL